MILVAIIAAIIFGIVGYFIGSGSKSATDAGASVYNISAAQALVAPTVSGGPTGPAGYTTTLHTAGQVPSFMMFQLGTACCATNNSGGWYCAQMTCPNVAQSPTIHSYSNASALVSSTQSANSVSASTK